jgi:hypothetical protein
MAGNRIPYTPGYTDAYLYVYPRRLAYACRWNEPQIRAAYFLLERMVLRPAAQLIFAAGLTAVVVSAHANIGLPLISVFLPPLWLGLVAIIAVEAVIIGRSGGYPLARVVVPVALANVLSTVVGVPVLWFVLATTEAVCCGTALGLATPMAKLYAVTVQAPWLIPYESEFWWMVPSALFTMGTICAAMSIVVETPIVSRMLGVESGSVWRISSAANIASYVTLGALGWLVIQLGGTMDALFQLFMPISEWLVDAVFRVGAWLAKGRP